MLEIKLAAAADAPPALGVPGETADCLERYGLGEQDAPEPGSSEVVDAGAAP